MRHLAKRFIGEGLAKLSAIKNSEVHAFIEKYVDLCNPDKVYVQAGTPEDLRYIRQ